MNAITTKAASPPERKERLAGEIRSVVVELSGFAESELAADSSFMELGFDSLFLTQASQALQKRFGVKIAFRQMADELSSIDALAGFLDRELPPDPPSTEPDGSRSLTSRISAVISEGAVPATETTGRLPGGESLIEKVIAQQMAVMREQLELLRGGQGTAPVSAQASDRPTSEGKAVSPVAKTTRRDAEGDLKRFGPFRGIEVGPKGGLTRNQAAALARLIERYNGRTAGSKAYAQRHRDRFCDPRAAGNFRQLWKEMVYPIVCARSQGGKIWDIDGNEYVDVTLGFGSNYFGHRPEFVIRALEDQLQKGFEIGPQTPLAGEVADMLCAMTGMERATFCNTGSEAVMAAMRVARTVTGRDKVVYFTGDYHGIFDEVLGHAARSGGRLEALPIAPGIPPLPNIIVLEYGAEASLDIIRQHSDVIAAVVVEPIQSRHPELQPRDFLHALRRLTEERGIALVFDEVVTGFRVAVGGAQEYFGVRADLATYGKVIGGGMPIGVLAGKRHFMDALDGGAWQFGDDSYPEVGVTFFAGTFIRHPLVMAAAHATLRHLQDAGPELQQRTTAKTVQLVETLNKYFRDVQVPIRLQSFGSVFYYDFHPDLKYAALLFYHLRDRGIHIWEGRVAQLCTAHTDEELARVVTAFQSSVEEMQEAGFLPGKTARSDAAEGKPECTFPLSESQREMWLGAQMRPEAAGPHHACTGLWLEGPLEIDQLRRAFELVIDRHESLRSTFNADGTEIIVHPAGGVERFFFEDLSGLPEHERAARAESVLQDEARRLLDLERGPLVYFRLLQLGPERHLLIFKAQMIVCDGWSHYLVFEELGAAYSAFVAGEEPLLKPAVQMREFARWQQDHGATEEARECEAFWLAQFKDVPPVLNLPTSRPRPPARTYDASRYDLLLGVELCQEIRRVAREQRKSYFAVLVAAFQVWLHRLSGCRDVVVGVPSAAQAPLGMDLFAGQCANTLPLRSQIDPAESFGRFLARTWSRVLDAQEHWDFTFGQLASKLDLPWDSSRIPLVSVLFNVDAPMSKVRFTGLKHRFFTGPRHYYQYDIGFNLVEEEEGSIRVECDYNSNLFDSEVIRVWTAAYEVLLRAIVRDVNQALGHLPMVSADENERVVHRGQHDRAAEAAVGDLTIHGLVAAQAAHTPDAVAVESQGARLSYRELGELARQVSEQLRKRGVGASSVVGVCLDRSVRLPVALLGVLETGAAYVAMDPELAVENLEQTVVGSGMELMLVDASTEAGLGAIAVRRVMIEDLLTESSDGVEAVAPETRVVSSALAYLRYTSRGADDHSVVEISHGAAVNLLLAMQAEPGCGSQDVMLGLSPASSSRSDLELWLPLSIGARLVMVPAATALDPKALSECLERHGITVMQATPSIWWRLVDSGWAGCKRLRAWSGDEALRPNLAKRLLPLCRELWNLYGATETAGWSMAARVESGAPVSLGKPIARTSIRIVDPQLQPVPIGVPGELVIAGAGLARGYPGQPELTARRFAIVTLGDDQAKRVYRTGDQARYTVDGRIEYVGRVGAQVDIRGFRIDPGEIEADMVGHEAISQAVVIVREDTPGNKLLVGYAIPAKSGLAGEDLRSFLRERMPGYMVPAQFVFLEAFPLTSNHKIDAAKLPRPEEKPPAPDEHRRNRKVVFVAPRTSTERALAEIWTQVLRIQQLGVHDNFFDLGGESMLAMRVVMLAGRRGMGLKPRSIFLHPTIAELAGVLVEPNNGPAIAASPIGSVPLTPAQIRFLHGRETLDPHHWNCSKLVQARPLNASAIKKALKALLAHHDALRLRLSNESGEWNQFIGEAGNELPFESHDLTNLEPGAQIEQIKTRCAELQTTLNLSRGPVLRAAHFGCGPEQPDRLFVTMHHFVSDELSWDVFWEDLESAYTQGLAGGPIELPPKTMSFREWSVRLRAMADSEAVRDTASRWLSLPWNEVRQLPLDSSAPPDGNTNASAQLCEVLLSAKETSQVVRPDGDYRPEEIMLAALARTLGKWTKSRAVLVDSLNHGRGIVEDADLSRTVGFMLCYQPLLVRIGDESEPEMILPAMVQEMRRLPEGFTFDLLRFFSGDEKVRNAFGKLPRSEVLFNFTGHQLESEPEEPSAFRRCDDACGPDHSPRNGRYYPLAVGGAIVGDRLRFRFVYSNNFHERGTIERLVGSYRKNLLEIVKARSERVVSCR